MAELLAGLGGLGQVSAGTFVAVILLLMLFGKIPTLRELRDTQADRDKWEAAAGDLLKAVTQYGMTLEKLLAYAETAQTILHTLQNLAERSVEREDPP